MVIAGNVVEIDGLQVHATIEAFACEYGVALGQLDLLDVVAQREHLQRHLGEIGG